MAAVQGQSRRQAADTGASARGRRGGAARSRRRRCRPAGLEADDVLASTAQCRRGIRWHHRDRDVRPGRLRPHRRPHPRAAHHQRWRRVFATDHGRATGLAARRPARPVRRLRRVARRSVRQPARRTRDRGQDRRPDPGRARVRGDRLRRARGGGAVRRVVGCPAAPGARRARDLGAQSSGNGDAG